MDKKLKQFFKPGINLCVQFIYVSIIYRMLDADKSHLDVTWVSQSLYSGPLSNPDCFLSLIAGRIRQFVLYKVSNESEIQPDPTMGCRVSCP